MSKEVFLKNLDDWYGKCLQDVLAGRESRRDELMKTIARGARIESLQSKVGGLSFSDGYEEGMKEAFSVVEMLAKKYLA